MLIVDGARVLVNAILIVDGARMLVGAIDHLLLFDFVTRLSCVEMCMSIEFGYHQLPAATHGSVFPLCVL